jgi:F-type H+-transporting ATPase subunit delta
VSQSGFHLSQIAGRYASAFFDLAQDAHALDAVEADLAKLTRIIDQSPDAARMVRSPVLSRAEQGRAMAALLAKAGSHDLTGKFVRLLAEKRRLFALQSIAAQFGKLLRDARGEMQAEVVSARPLKEAHLSALKGALKEAYKRDIRLDAKIDPALIGGLVVKAGSRQIDFSIRSKLKALEIAMKGA